MFSFLDARFVLRLFSGNSPTGRGVPTQENFSCSCRSTPVWMWIAPGHPKKRHAYRKVPEGRDAGRNATHSDSSLRQANMDAATAPRIPVEEARRKVVAGGALLVCAYDDD